MNVKHFLACLPAGRCETSEMFYAQILNDMKRETNLRGRIGIFTPVTSLVEPVNYFKSFWDQGVTTNFF